MSDSIETKNLGPVVLLPKPQRKQGIKEEERQKIELIDKITHIAAQGWPDKKGLDIFFSSSLKIATKDKLDADLFLSMFVGFFKGNLITSKSSDALKKRAFLDNYLFWFAKFFSSLQITFLTGVFKLKTPVPLNKWFTFIFHKSKQVSKIPLSFLYNIKKSKNANLLDILGLRLLQGHLDDLVKNRPDPKKPNKPETVIVFSFCLENTTAAHPTMLFNSFFTKLKKHNFKKKYKNALVGGAVVTIQQNNTLVCFIILQWQHDVCQDLYNDIKARFKKIKPTIKTESLSVGILGLGLVQQFLFIINWYAPKFKSTYTFTL
jgi:hypothetical protein